ncbi:hypothetical protein PGTUg99_030128 [Puccinia graminis f. sp. tritici]|uniref:PWWP domain-containing protein n=1 Tax=Puccinia graminis f. sp. tritici TaxID=56615 RepID=A0A5B0NX10_PUCGR|nr:hypothetical protein PGTUg99_030128 [Puccinia graminis f. sp. tritici]
MHTAAVIPLADRSQALHRPNKHPQQTIKPLHSSLCPPLPFPSASLPPLQLNRNRNWLVSSTLPTPLSPTALTTSSVRLSHRRIYIYPSLSPASLPPPPLSPSVSSHSKTTSTDPETRSHPTHHRAVSYSFGDIVLAKVKGHPAWPARIVDPYASPLNLRDERKIAQKNSYLVKFFKTADYAWMNAKEMSILERTEIQAFINNPNKKGADLKAAYQIALAPEAWEADLEARLVAAEEDYNALEIDELEPVDAEGTEKAVSAKSKQKRKRPSETKTPAVSTKKRKSVDARPTNVPAQASATPESPPAAPAIKKRGKKKEEPAAPVDGEAVVREWRHRLQRLFLGKAALNEKMMPEIDGVFTDIEQFEMQTEWLTSSKLAKVLKRVGVLEDSKVPLDAKYSIRARARALQEKWRNQLGLGEESTHRSKAADGTDEAKANASADDGNGKENTDPTGTKKMEEVVMNGKEPTKPSDPDSMKMDEDEPMPVKVAEIDQTEKVVEAAPSNAAEITEPQTEAPEASPPAEPKAEEAVNGEFEAMDAEPVAHSGKPEAANDDTEAVNDAPEAKKAEPEAVNGKSELVNGKPESVNGKSESVNGKPESVNGKHESVTGESEAINAEPKAINGETEGINGKPEATSDEPKVVNGDHETLKEDEATEPAAKPDQDVEMATADAEPKITEKAPAQEPEDEGEQMDCADSPEPTTAEKTHADKEEAE